MYQSIGDRIRIRRQELGMTQEELAKKLGYASRVSVNKIELNGRNLTQTKIKLLADILETTPAYIMGWDDTEIKIETDADVLADLAKDLSSEKMQQLITFAKFLKGSE